MLQATLYKQLESPGILKSWDNTSPKRVGVGGFGCFLSAAPPLPRTVIDEPADLFEPNSLSARKSYRTYNALNR